MVSGAVLSKSGSGSEMLHSLVEGAQQTADWMASAKFHMLGLFPQALQVYKVLCQEHSEEQESSEDCSVSHFLVRIDDISGMSLRKNISSSVYLRKQIDQLLKNLKLLLTLSKNIW